MLSICQTIHSDASQYRVNILYMFTICHLKYQSLKGKCRFVNGWFVNVLPPLTFPSLPCSNAPSLPGSVPSPASSLHSFPCAVPDSFRSFLARSLHQPFLPLPSLPPLTLSPCIASSLLTLLLPPSLPPSRHPSLPPSLPPSLLASLPTIDTCNEQDINTVDARTFPWV